MVLWSISYFISILISYIWVTGSPLGPHLYIGESIAAAVSISGVVVTWILYIATIITSQLGVYNFILALVVLLQLTSSHFLPCIKNIRSYKNYRFFRDDLVCLGFITFCFFVFYHHFGSLILPPNKNDTLNAGGSVYGDLPIHLAVVNALIHGVDSRISYSQMMSPIFAGEKMTYPFLQDFHAAAIVSLGGSFRDGFFIPSLLMLLATFAHLYYLGLRMTKSRVGGIVANLLVVFAGGTGAWRFLQEKMKTMSFGEAWESTLFEDVIQHDPIEGEYSYMWFSFIPHVMLPQRGANFAYPLAVFVLTLVWIGSEETLYSLSGDTELPSSSTASKLSVLTSNTSQFARRYALMTASLFACCLPLFQAHSFAGVGIIIGTVFILDFHKWLKDGYIFRSWLYAGMIAVVLGIPQLTRHSKTVKEGFYGKFTEWGWLHRNYHFGQNDFTYLPLIGNFVSFWLRCLSLCLPLFFIGMLFLVLEMVNANRIAKSAKSDKEILHILATMSMTRTDLNSTSSPDLDVPRRPRQLTPLRLLFAPLIDSLFSPVDVVVRVVRWPRVDAFLSFFSIRLNALSSTGRAFDVFKFGIGGFLVFLLAAVYRMQPWDRDNSKTFYVGLFTMSIVSSVVISLGVDAIFKTDSYGKSVAIPLSSSSTPSTSSEGFDVAPHRLFNDTHFFGSVQAADAKLSYIFQESPELSANSKEFIVPNRQISPMRRRFPIVLLILAPLILLVNCLSGFMLLYKEVSGRLNVGAMFDQSSIYVGEYVKKNTAPGAVILHDHKHVQPTLSLAGRPSLVAYYGWVSNHGYNCHDRLKDRDYIMGNLVKKSDPHTYNLLRRWGVRYVLGENIHHHNDGNDSINLLEGKVTRILAIGRFEFYMVNGY